MGTLGWESHGPTGCTQARLGMAPGHSPALAWAKLGGFCYPAPNKSSGRLLAPAGPPAGPMHHLAVSACTRSPSLWCRGRAVQVGAGCCRCSPLRPPARFVWALINFHLALSAVAWLSRKAGAALALIGLTFH